VIKGEEGKYGGLKTMILNNDFRESGKDLNKSDWRNKISS
jgi:hypothetical protein